MSRFIISRTATASGRLPDVGMNDRFVWSGRTMAGAMRAAKSYGAGRLQVRIERMDDVNFYRAPVETIVLTITEGR